MSLECAWSTEPTDWLASMRKAVEDRGVALPVPPIPQPPSSRSPRIRRRWKRALALWSIVESIRCTPNELDGAHFQGLLQAELCKVTRGTPEHTDDTHYRRWCNVWRRLLSRSELLMVARRECLTGVSYEGEFVRGCIDNDWSSHEKPYVPIEANLLAEPRADAKPIDMHSALPIEVSTRYRDFTNSVDENKDDRIARLHETAVMIASWARGVSTLSTRAVRMYIDCVSWAPVTKQRKPHSVLRHCRSSGGTSSAKFLRLCQSTLRLFQCMNLWANAQSTACMPGGRLRNLIWIRIVNAPGPSTRVRRAHTCRHMARRAHQCAPPLYTYELPDWVVKGRWPPRTRLRPRCTLLVVGHTHSCFILMQGNSRIIEMGIEILKLSSALKLLNGPTPLQDGVAVNGSGGPIYLHIDDLLVSAGEHDLTNAVLSNCSWSDQRWGSMSR